MLEDATFWTLIGLILFLALLVYMKVPGAITGALDKRAASISDELDQARKLREEAQSLLAEYQRKAREAESEAEEIIDQAKREAEAIGVEARQRMEEYVSSRTRMAEEKIAQAEIQALQEVKALSADVAIAAAERLLAAKAKGEKADALVASAIEDVKNKLH
ncbi:F0F1 ATP synthase subunit B [Bauldia sp.]|uniref:F0F1 ATP synthase subunit B n=1 Tax=Bauldia sp. TaxID=2575872 RepID=UPI003BAAEE34